MKLMQKRGPRKKVATEQLESSADDLIRRALNVRRPASGWPWNIKKRPQNSLSKTTKPKRAT